SKALDAFNVANNVPDLLFALISGGALAMAFIPVLTETLTQHGERQTWQLFSHIANLAFLVTGLLGVLVGVFAQPLVTWELGIAPGFGSEQQRLVVTLMRLNLVATVIFSLSGLVMAALQAHQHFLLPAMAPLFYNLGQIFGAVVLAPERGLSFGGLTLPAIGLGVHGLVYGVILGALLHLGIQIPGLIRYKFRWQAGLGLQSPEVRKVLRLMGPRLLTVLCIQLIFIVRDNLASRLATGAVTALTYGWMIFQVPETLIGTALGTALLPTLSEQVARDQSEHFRDSIQRAVRVLVALTIPLTFILGLGMRPLLEMVFGFGAEGTDLLWRVSQAYLLGLLGQCIVEIMVRAFYARQNAWVPLVGAGITLGIYILAGTQLYRWLGAPGISLADALAFSIEALILTLWLSKTLNQRFSAAPAVFRAVIAAFIGGGAIILGQSALHGVNSLWSALGLMGVGGILALPWIWQELRLLIRL
ncbi:MAG: murein biosynthesis integral membrane protein MurJ, partial [Thermanaerothrix sp.]|nr:murein biosynthesis integral membrane protein MurJ [Thermanaerothrix sp.]